MAIPYVNGEPFISKEIGKAIKIATENNVASMIATNGLLLNEKNINIILDNGLDFIKVHVSGFSRDAHSIQHRVGDVELIKNNLRLLSRMIGERNAPIIVMVDYILYKHNAHEVELFRKFADNLGFMFSTRTGNPHGMEDKEDRQYKGNFPVNLPCDWLWKVLTINWNGDILPCCDYVTWSDVKGYGRFSLYNTNISEVWNGPHAISM
jgi:MoaA/NifB/PqqE/SkfB family radical SAM enzyme